LFQINPDRPDGFNASFYKENWYIVEKSIHQAISSFFQTREDIEGAKGAPTNKI